MSGPRVGLKGRPRTDASRHLAPDVRWAGHPWLPARPLDAATRSFRRPSLARVRRRRPQKVCRTPHGTPAERTRRPTGRIAQALLGAARSGWDRSAAIWWAFGGTRPVMTEARVRHAGAMPRRAVAAPRRAAWAWAAWTTSVPSETRSSSLVSQRPPLRRRDIRPTRPHDNASSGRCGWSRNPNGLPYHCDGHTMGPHGMPPHRARSRVRAAARQDR